MEIYNNVITVLKNIAKMCESPYWDKYDNTVKFVDIPNKKLLSYSEETGTVKTWMMADVVGSTNPAGKDKCIASLNCGLYLYDLKNNSHKVLYERTDYSKKSTRFNDSKCDASGRLWVGTTDMERNKICSLYKFTDKLEECITGLTISNGIAWTPDNKTMYHIDTWPRHIWKYNFDVETGTILDKSIAFTIPEELCYPDGMTIDEEGMLWIAFWGGGCICRFNPDNGEKLAVIKMPVKYPSCCTFGGKNLNKLFITSAVSDDKSPFAGSLFCVELPYKGMLPNEFNLQ